MTTVWDNIKEVISNLEPLLLVIIPTCFGIYLKVKNKLIIEKAKQVKQNEEKNQEKLKNWEHTASINVIKDVRLICNHYRDIGHMDLVNYIQLENGTIATSKLCNMFITCLAEDNRGSIIPKMFSSIQRVPYSRLIEVIDDAKDNVIICDDFKASNVNNRYVEVLNIVPGFNSVGSYIAAPVKDNQGYLIGFCLFLYTHIMDKNDKADNVDLMNKFVAGVEAIFLKYNEDRYIKKKELNLV